MAKIPQLSISEIPGHDEHRGYVKAPWLILHECVESHWSVVLV